MYHSKVVLCGINTSKLTVLTEEEKKTLMKRVREGDESARQEMICGNLRLVLSIVQRFAGRKENPDDLFQVGCIGLVKAVDNFDTEKEVMFSTYAVPMIIGEIRRFLRDSSAVRVSRSVRVGEAVNTTSAARARMPSQWAGSSSHSRSQSYTSPS